MIMKRTIIFVILILASAFGSFAAIKDSGITVLSYNIRQGSCPDGTNCWDFRAPANMEMLKEITPDIICFQEPLDIQIKFIKYFYDDYKGVGVGSKDGKKAGEISEILYNAKSMSLAQWGTFWLSATPDKPSAGWDVDSCRTATWAFMKDKKTGNRLLVVNAHLDSFSEECRIKSIELIKNKIAEINKDNVPVILAGSFNMTPDNPALKSLGMTDTRKSAVKTDTNGTFNNWGKSKNVIYDYIFTTGLGCTEFETIIKPYGKRTFISDHFPVKAKLMF